MVITLGVANDVNRDNEPGEDRYFLSQARTVRTSKERLYKFFCKEFEVFYYELSDIDISIPLIFKFSRWQDGKDTWKDEDSWTNRFNDFTFPNICHADIVEISKDLYEAIQEEILN